MDVETYVDLELARLPREASLLRKEVFHRARAAAKRKSAREDRIRAVVALVASLALPGMVLLALDHWITDVTAFHGGIALIAGFGVFLMMTVGDAGNTHIPNARDLLPDRNWLVDELTHSVYEKYPAGALLDLDFEAQVLTGTDSSPRSTRRMEVLVDAMVQDVSVADAARSLVTC